MDTRIFSSLWWFPECIDHNCNHIFSCILIRYELSLHNTAHTYTNCIDLFAELSRQFAYYTFYINISKDFQQDSFNSQLKRLHASPEIIHFSQCEAFPDLNGVCSNCSQRNELVDITYPLKHLGKGKVLILICCCLDIVFIIFSLKMDSRFAYFHPF